MWGHIPNSALIGTARRYSSAEPSLPVQMVKQHRVASPGIVLDEIEKGGTGRHNGNLIDGLLGLLEPQSSSAWVNPYIQSPCDLSHVIWLATANDITALPLPFRDRVRTVKFPEPGPEHLAALASHLLTKTVSAAGLGSHDGHYRWMARNWLCWRSIGVVARFARWQD